eukprot:ANDGO_08200.mRNA.1 hypothetical protein AMSG_02023
MDRSMMSSFYSGSRDAHNSIAGAGHSNGNGAGNVSVSNAMSHNNRDIDGLSFDDVCGTTSEWRNIQDVVRNSLRVLFELVQETSSRLRDLERAHANADRSSRAHLDESLASIHDRISALSKLVATSYSTKEDISAVETSLLSRLRNNDSQRVVEQQLAACIERIEKLENENSKLKRHAAAAVTEKSLVQALEKKANFFDMQTLRTLISDCESKIEFLSESMSRYKTDLERIVAVEHDKRALHEAVSSALDRAENALSQTATLHSSISASAPSHRKPSSSSKSLASHGLEESTELKRELVLKADIKDVSTMLDTKANADEVNTAINRLIRDVESKAPLSDLQSALRDQAVINEALCSQLSLGRWLWTCHKLKSGHGVPWNIQSANTDPDNFRWDPDRVNILVEAAGLYEVTFGFYSKRKPTLQLHVNGEPVLSAVNSASYVVHHSSGRLTDTGKQHPAGNIAGLTLIDFLALPARCKVAVSFAGEADDAEGFLGLRKL